MNQLEKDIDELHRRDPIAEAETITGISYKESDAVTFLGMGIMQDISAKKKAAAILMMDTYWCMPIADYITCIERMGFEKVFQESIKAEIYGEKHDDEHFMFWISSKGVLLHFDTYGKGGGINGGKFYYNIRPHDWKEFTARSSGGMRKDGTVWSGDHDCRQGVKHHLEMLSQQGEFLPKWVDRPFLWLLHWADTKVEGYDYAAINESRIKKLPKHVRDAITP